jgi:S-formylglutathione hydrolase FrmB
LSSVEAGGGRRTADAYAASHLGLAPIVVFADPNGAIRNDTECVDGRRGLAETYMTEDIPNFVQSTYGASPDPKQHVIAGLSAGGTCALLVALRRPDVYRTFIDLSGDLGPNIGDKAHTIDALFSGDTVAWDAHDPLTLLARRPYPELTAWIAAASGETSHLVIAEQIAKATQAAGIDTTYVVRPGKHNFAFWAASLREAFTWVCGRLDFGAR